MTTLHRETIGGFSVCEKAADNYKYLRSIGITVRKTIDIIIGTFCIEKGYEIIHMIKISFVWNNIWDYIPLKPLRTITIDNHSQAPFRSAGDLFQAQLFTRIVK